MTDLVTISYRSEALLSDPLDDLMTIVEESKPKNAARAITGVLLFDGTFFMQTLEGPPKNTKDMYRSVLRDPRHRKVKPFGIEGIDERDFPDWHMELISPDETMQIVPDMRNLEFSYRRLREIQAMSLVAARRQQNRTLH